MYLFMKLQKRLFGIHYILKHYRRNIVIWVITQNTTIAVYYPTDRFGLCEHLTHTQ